MKATTWILGDQLLMNHSALKNTEDLYGKDQLVVLFIESDARTRRLPYQSKKLVLLFSAMRHFAERLKSSGYDVDYQIAPNTRTALDIHIQKYRPEILFCMASSEFMGRKTQKNLKQELEIPVEILPNTQFLCGRFNPFPDLPPEKRIIQERFYRRMRTHFNLLIEQDGQPMGGAWNFDKRNRKRLPKDNHPPPPISFEPDSITRTVMQEVDLKYSGMGEPAGFNLAVTHEQADEAANDFFDHRLSSFGPYEDAMSSDHTTMYHSRLSPYINLGLLDPLSLAREAQRRYIAGKAPINSAEGFVRQVVGWREYIYWQYWRLMPDICGANYWHFERPLPSLFWNGNTEMNCLQHIIHRAIDVGYNHHIERLMILSNFCLLTGIKPSAVNDWFLSAYIDAYEWVMVPNVLGMGLYADGGLIATKPYIASSNYINKMSDYCQDCAYDRKQRTGDKACPFNFLYWNFILEHEDTLRSLPRMGRSLLGLRHLDEAERRLVKGTANQFLRSLDKA